MNLALISSFWKKIRKTVLTVNNIEPVDISGCDLHLIHSAFKNAAESSGCNIKNTPLFVLNETPPRGNDYESVTSNICLLNFCATW